MPYITIGKENSGNIGDSLLHVLAHQEVRHALERDRPDD